jgi:VWFA-related protein
MRQARRVPAVWMVIAVLWAGAAAQQPPTFRMRVDLVTVDVTVLDREGRQVTGLQPELFTLEVDGKRRNVVSVQYVSYERPPAPGDPAARAPSSGTRYMDARVVLTVVNQENVCGGGGGAALRAADAFIETLSPDDRIAALSVDAAGPIEFTSDHLLVKRHLSTLLGRAVSMPSEFPMGLAEALGVADGSRAWLDRVVTRVCGQPLARVQRMERMAADDGMRDPCPTHVEQQARALAHSARSQGEGAVDAVKRLLRRLDDIEGPKILVLLSEGLVAEPRLVDMTEVALLAQQARATIYVLQVDVPLVEAADDAISPTLGDDVRVRGDGLARLAGATGGALLQLVGSNPAPFSRILRESSGHYLLAFEPVQGDRDGASHRISVSVRRPEVIVRARPVFSAPAPQTAPLTIEDQLVQLLRTRRQSTDLGVRLGVATLRSREGQELHARATIALEAPLDATYGAVVVDGGGTVVTSATSRTTTGQLSFPVVVPPGRYLFRAAAIDPGGRAGTVERTLDIRLNGTRLQTSDIVLTAPTRESGELPVVDQTSAAVLRAAIEIYAPEDWKEHGAVRLELSSASGGPARPAEGFADWSADGHWVLTGAFALAELPAGRYLVTARIPGEAAVTKSIFLVR